MATTNQQVNLGNAVKYYAPKILAGTKPSKPAVPPKKEKKANREENLTENLKSKNKEEQAPATGEEESDTSKKFITNNFDVIHKAPFSGGKPLSPTFVLSDADIVVAMLECGYGPKKEWTSYLVNDEDESKELEAYLNKRRELIQTLLKKDATDSSLSVNKITRHIETSEKSDISFAIGAIFTYKIASLWLEACGTSMAQCLHPSIYAKAQGNKEFSPEEQKQKRVNIEYGSGKSPDFIVYDNKKDWHLFESKGGQSPWAPIVDGLRQLASVSTLGWSKEAQKQPLTRICSHTLVSSGKKIETLVIDPPSDSLPEKENPNEPPASIQLIQSVCRLMKVVETIDQFRALSNAEEPSPSNGLLRFGRSSYFGGLEVALPNIYLENEMEIRLALSTYLAIRESIETDEFQKSPNKKVTLKRLVQSRFQSEGIKVCPWFNFESLPDTYGTFDFYKKCASRLRMPALTRKLKTIGDTYREFAFITRSTGFMRTTGKLYIRTAGGYDDRPQLRRKTLG